MRWLFDFRGRVTRYDYLRAGIALMVIKLTLDWLLCTSVFPQPWSPLIYVMAVPGSALQTGTEWQWLVMAMVAVPFCWVGAALTVRRLRDAGLSPWYSAFFVLPIANFVLFVVAATVPTARTQRRPPASPPPPVPWCARPPLPALIAFSASGLMLWLAIKPLATYGGVLFLGLPFIQGFLVGALAERRGFGGAMQQFFLSALLSMAAMLLLGAEGLVCILMAAPVWMVMGICGVVLGRTVTGEVWRAVSASLLLMLTALLLEPLVMPAPSVFEVTTDVVVAAPAQRVWDSLVTFGEIEQPSEFFFRAGIAYPVRATIEGRGTGAVRRCSFNTGDFVEPIEVWDEPRLLRFSVEQCPQPMIEWNPLHDHVDAAHLHGFFAARQGQFLLLPQADGTTLLRGTTWYSHGLRPEPYWSLWSDWLVHAIHVRVLEHIRERAEG